MGLTKFRVPDLQPLRAPSLVRQEFCPSVTPIYAEVTDLLTILVRVYQLAFTLQNITDSLTIHGC